MKQLTDSPYTLVLDLDETLIHFVNPMSQLKTSNTLASDLAFSGESKEEFFYMVRPFCNKFLTALSKYYEIVLWTAARKDYTDWILSGIDLNKNISYRLYRQHCFIGRIPGKRNNFKTTKDLRLIGRDIKKTIIIDNLA